MEQQSYKKSSVEHRVWEISFWLLRICIENLGLVAIGLNALDTSPVEIDWFSGHNFYSK